MCVCAPLLSVFTLIVPAAMPEITPVETVAAFGTVTSAKVYGVIVSELVVAGAMLLAVYVRVGAVPFV